MNMKNLEENFLPLLEFIILGFALYIPTFFNFSLLFHDFFTKEPLSPENFICWLAFNNGNYIAGVLLVLYVLHLIHDYNSDYLFNRENVYHNYPYIWYFLCAKVLNIKKS